MEFCFLSKEFYEKYKKCKEILVKQDRPYTVLIIETVNKKFAIPFRSHINPNCPGIRVIMCVGHPVCILCLVRIFFWSKTFYHGQFFLCAGCPICL